jgi:hypothetical protein
MASCSVILAEPVSTLLEVIMMRPIWMSMFVVAVSGCASSGGGETIASVPVYDSVTDVPCAFEVARTVRGESSARVGGSPFAFERERAVVLGRAAARAGLDAVLVVPVEEGVQRRATASSSASADVPRLTFVGEGLRCTDAGCSGR